MGERFRGDAACRDALRDRGLPRAPGGRDPGGCLQERRLQRSGPRARGAGARSGADRTFRGRDRTSDRRGGRASGPSRRAARRCGPPGAPARATGRRGPGAVLGIAGLLVGARVDYHRLRVLAVPLLLVAVALLVAVLVPSVGVTAGGATRWLRFGGIAGLQPAELAKLALIVYLATWLGARREQIGSWRITVPFVLITMTVIGLVVAEPDLGTAIVIIVVALAIYFAAGARLQIFAALGILTAVSVLALAVVNPERYERLLTFVDPWSESRCAGFQSIQTLYALALGGSFGEGLGAGREKFGYLPHPYTDSIFAVLGDELGLA